MNEWMDLGWCLKDYEDVSMIKAKLSTVVICYFVLIILDFIVTWHGEKSD